MHDSFSNPPARSFLLVPSMPTPNGRLHLGHVAGPFLRLDVAARFLRSRGHRARLVTGTDPFESHVLLQAQRRGESPAALAGRATAGIQEDLASMSIHCDRFVDPLSAADGERYARHVEASVRELAEAGVARRVERAFPTWQDGGEPIPRSFIEGRCPECDAWMGGSVCEGCGCQILAEQVREPRCRADIGARCGSWRQFPTLELALAPDELRRAGIAEALAAQRLPERCSQIVRRSLQRGLRMELTTPGSWGVGYPSPGPGPQVAFTYATPYPWMMVMRELFGEDDAAQAPFSPDSEVVTVTAFGVDITECWVVGTVALARLLGTRSYDHYLGNEFLRLEGEKFSTSRGHVIWVADLIEKTPVDADMARYYLATLDPRDAETDFRVAGLVSTVNEVLLPMFHDTVEAALRHVGAGLPAPASEVMKARLGALLDEQAASFDLEDLHLARVAAVARRWAESWREQDAASAYWFLKGLALVCAPLMPGFASRLSRRLGAEPEPTLAALLTPTTPVPWQPEPAMRRLRVADLRRCLPASLRRPAAVAEVSVHA